MTLYEYLHRQKEWSLNTFGPGDSVEKHEGLIVHICKELDEIMDDPSDTVEWIDVAILALEGALRSKDSVAEVIDEMITKQLVNENRIWPNWEEVEPGVPIEHIEEGDGFLVHLYEEDEDA